LFQNMKFNRFALVLYHQTNGIINGFDIAVAFKNDLGHLFKDNPVILPDDAPPGVPRLVYKNDPELNLTVFQDKTEFNQMIGEHISSEEVLERFVSLSSSVISVVDKIFNGISRVGLVVFTRLSLEEPGVEFIRNRYISKEKFSDVIGAEAHWLNQPTISEERVNQWVRVSSDTNENNTPNFFIDIIIDTNTIGNRQTPFKTPELSKLIDDWHIGIRDRFDSIIRL